jgi:lactate permease
MADASDALLAAAPFITIFVLMVVFRLPAAKAALAGLGLTLVLAWAWFGFEDSGVGRLTATAGATAEAAFSTATILWIIGGALSIHHLSRRSGATAQLQSAVTGLTPDPRLKAILVAWFFALFLEGAAGFGTPVALAAPLLVAFGFRPVEAVSVALLGHAVGVSFGAVGTPVFAQEAITGIDAGRIAERTALVHLALGTVMLASLLVVVGQTAGLAAAGPRIGFWGWGVLAAAAFLGPSYAVARWLGAELPTMAGALLGGAVFAGVLVLLQQVRGRRRATDGEAVRANGGAGELSLARAAAPYLALVALVVVTRLIGPVKEGLQAVEVEWAFAGAFRGSFQPLYHPGTLLFIAFGVGGFVQGQDVRQLLGALLGAGKQLLPVVVALGATLALSRLMVHAGMTTALAAAAADATGALWPLFAPLAGVLGTFTTGSATASNILMTDFQFDTAQRIDASPVAVVAAQGVGAAVGNVVAPHNIIAGGATVGLAGREGEVLRRTVGPCLLYALAAGAFVLMLTRV